MKKGAGKSKGSGYELNISRILTKWFDPTSKVDLFYRSASSGAQASLAKRFGKKSNQHGDIKATDERTMFITDALFFECKFYRDWKIDLVLTTKNCLIRDWWVKCSLEAYDDNKIPVLIFKRNGSPDFIIVSDRFIVNLISWNSCFKRRCIRFNIVDDKREFFDGVSMYLLSDFLQWVDPVMLKLILSKEIPC